MTVQIERPGQLIERPRHAWMPASTCDTDCIDRDVAKACPVVVAIRVLFMAILLISFPLVYVLTPGGVEVVCTAATPDHCCHVSA